MQTVAPAAAGHQAAGELVDDDDLAVLDDVVLVALEEHVGACRACWTWWLHLHVGRCRRGCRCRAAVRTLSHALFGQRDGAVLFVDGVIAGVYFSPGSLPSITSPRTSLGMMRLTL